MGKQEMYKIALAALLSCSAASAQVASSMKEAHEQVASKCLSGCLVLSPKEVASLEGAIQKAIQEAYEAGLRGWSKSTSQQNN